MLGVSSTQRALGGRDGESQQVAALGLGGSGGH